MERSPIPPDQKLAEIPLHVFPKDTRKLCLQPYEKRMGVDAIHVDLLEYVEGDPIVDLTDGTDGGLISGPDCFRTDNVLAVLPIVDSRRCT